MKHREVYRRVYLRLWRHSDFRFLNDSERLLALYMLSGPQTNQIGCYYFSPALAAEDLGVTVKTLTSRLRSICKPFGWEWREDSRLFYVPSWLDWNRPNGPNATTAWRDEADRVNDPMLRRRLLDAIGMPSSRHSDVVAIQEQEQEQDQEQEQKQEVPPNPPSGGRRLTAKELQKAREHIARIGGCGHGLTHSVGECARMLALSWRGEQVSA